MNDGLFAVGVIRVLEAISTAMKKGGAATPVRPDFRPTFFRE
jgi:hypothetical protein